jgi:hypothetical protein
MLKVHISLIVVSLIGTILSEINTFGYTMLNKNISLVLFPVFLLIFIIALMHFLIKKYLGEIYSVAFCVKEDDK